MRAVRPIFLALLLLLGTSACSAEHNPQAWAASVCTALSPWRTQISALTTRTQQQMVAATTPSQAKENLVRLFGGARTATEEARAGVERAGVPDVADGKRISAGFIGALTGMRDAYDRATSGIQGLAITPAESFYAQVQKVVEQLNKDYQQSGLDTADLDSVELKRAFDSLPECQ